jgi:D-amino-acid dehydrogenase
MLSRGNAERRLRQVARTALVLGAGMVGVSVALHLRRRGWDVVMVDRQGPGEGASFGNGGLIQREAVYPHPFPRELAELWRIARNRSVDVAYHPLALPGLAAPLLRYWWHSAPKRYARAVLGHSRLIATCLDEHMALARDAEATNLLRPIGWLQAYGTAPGLERAMAKAEAAQREFGINSVALDGRALAQAEPHLLTEKLGAIHWTDPYSVSDPHALTLAYARLFTREGGAIMTGDARGLERSAAGWRVTTTDGRVEAAQAVVALGAASTEVTRRFGYAPPLFGKRGYHMHYSLRGNTVLNRPLVDADTGFAVVPMRRGIRLTTGVEFARTGAPPSPVQLERAEPAARALLPLDRPLDTAPWMGVRPALPDMLPVIGRAPTDGALWCAFGHAHQGLTLGPSTGRLLAEMMSGEGTFLDPEPYRPGRF